MEIYEINGKLVKISRSEFLDLFEKKVLELFHVDKNEEIVELGCGIGNKLFFLWKNGFTNLSGVDISENAINLARDMNRIRKCGISFHVADLTKQLPDLEGRRYTRLLALNNSLTIWKKSFRIS